jgi:hypothetical protein
VTQLLEGGPSAEALEDLISTTPHAPLAARAVSRLDGFRATRLLGDRRSAVRRAAWHRVVAAGWPIAAASVVEGAMDAERAVRRIAAWVARRDGVELRAALLAAPTDTPRRKARRLSALAEIGAPEAGDLAAEGLDDPDPRVRIAAIGVLAARTDADALLVARLPEAAGGELRALVDALVARRPFVPDATLDALRARGEGLAALRVQGARGGWDRPIAALLASGDADPAVVAAGRAALADWRRRTAAYVPPPSELDRQRLRQALLRADVPAGDHDYVVFVAGLSA